MSIPNKVITVRGVAQGERELARYWAQRVSAERSAGDLVRSMRDLEAAARAAHEKASRT